MSAVTDNPIAPETSENKMNFMGEDIFALDGADLLDTLLLTNECVSCLYFMMGEYVMDTSSLIMVVLLH